ncbi:hypothetical protein H310_12174 [Aphanomyces invadans]|uniref:UDENN domain-containing protein n=1 Tax=Aphanomyces invadans TaxID=157072 RepID=A0A024TJD7_9STRA|nr:hypothetical protein H310_12174 [Aphanomyces invadans]ETV94173.1 hypothetical protein H310_12174 [Aphanomyces invadans]|eukprot:XP_008877376.1 hypothetical protein H310_12174 [Aphanomyces invadans]
MAENADTRLVEYFFVATKTGNTHSIVFQYPPQNHDRDEYPQSVLLFMFPSRSADSPPAMYNAFVLTTATGSSLYGASVCMSSSTSNNHADAACLTSLCIVSKHPLYTAFLQYLEQLAVLGSRQHRRNRELMRNDVANPPEKVRFVEQCLTNLLHEVPVPRFGSSGVLCSVAETNILLQAAPLDWEFVEYTFQLVEPENLVMLVHHAMLEHSILILGTDNLFITAVATTIRLLLTPLQWDHVFVPVVPHGVDIATLLEAPVPFIAGAHASQVPHPASLSSPTAVVRFDMRDNRLHGSRARLPMLPQAAEALVRRLNGHIMTMTEGGPPSLLPQILRDRRIRMQTRLREAYDSTTATDKEPTTNDDSKLSTSLLTDSSPLNRVMVKWFRRLVCEYRSGLDVLGAKKFLAQKTGPDKAFYVAWSNTSAFQQQVDGSATSGSSSSLLRIDRDDADDDEDEALGHHEPLHPIHVPLRPVGHDLMAAFLKRANAPQPAEEGFPCVTPPNAADREIAFPTLSCDALSASRPKLPYEVPEVASSKSRKGKPNSTVVEWLDNWLHGGKLDKSPPAIFHRAKTLGSHLSPRLNFHRTKTSLDIPDHSWLHTTCSPECMENVATCTRVLDDVWTANKKPSQALEQAYVELIHTLGACHDALHRQDLEAVWKTCLGVNPLGGIFNQLGHWRPFSWLIKTWMDQGDVALAVTWLAQIQMHQHHPIVPTTPTSPRLFGVSSSETSSSSSLHTTTTSCSDAMAASSSTGVLAACMEVELEPLVHRVYTTFGIGSLGLVLQPFNEKRGCQVAGFQHQDERCRIEEGDVVETIDGKPMMLMFFHDIVTYLVERPRPMTVSFIRGLSNVEDVFQTSRPVKLRPRREMHDRFGELFERGIRLTLLADCAACGHRVSELDLQVQCRSTCPNCHAPFSPFFCVRYMDQPPSTPIPYFSWSYLHARLTAHDGGDDSNCPLPKWYAKDPHVYWNIVVKCLCLDCPLDSFLVDLQDDDQVRVDDSHGPETTPMDDQELCLFVLGLPSSPGNPALAVLQALAKQLLHESDPEHAVAGSPVTTVPAHRSLINTWRKDRAEPMATKVSSTMRWNNDV